MRFQTAFENQCRLKDRIRENSPRRYYPDRV
uniref:Uncharacterized protein n=2 Tax=Neisseria meningitidis TaxID=487 RepID=I4E8N1_NEIME|nr:hypothetical protein predicted by Glimmer/Critica [Neisseria meningitidis alpha153]CCA45700.1 hypothetical protein NMALPHA522_2159 [Neisseria meningitidis alpha522]